MDAFPGSRLPGLVAGRRLEGRDSKSAMSKSRADHLLPDRHSVLISSQTQLQHRGIAPFTMSPPISLARPAPSTCSRLHSTISSGTTHAPRHVPIIRSVPQLRRWRKEARSRGLEVGLVPTVSTGCSPTMAAVVVVRSVGSKFFPRADQMVSAPSLCRSSPTKTNFLATDGRRPDCVSNADTRGGVGDRTTLG